MAELFLSIDEIEDLMGKLTIDMTRWELVSYLKQSMTALYGSHLMVEGDPEPSIMGKLQKTYGQHDAGLIVKWVVWKHFCRDSANPGQYVKFTSFASGRKWWTDLIHAEMQAQVRKENAPPVKSTMISSAKFL